MELKPSQNHRSHLLNQKKRQADTITSWLFPLKNSINKQTTYFRQLRIKRPLPTHPTISDSNHYEKPQNSNSMKQFTSNNPKSYQLWMAINKPTKIVSPFHIKNIYKPKQSRQKTEKDIGRWQRLGIQKEIDKQYYQTQLRLLNRLYEYTRER